MLISKDVPRVALGGRGVGDNDNGGRLDGRRGVGGSGRWTVVGSSNDKSEREVATMLVPLPHGMMVLLSVVRSR